MTSCCQTYRQHIVDLIMEIQQKFQQISRNSMFLAVSILDAYLQKSYEQWQAQTVNSGLYAIVCYLLAWKFQGDSHPSVENLKKCLNISGDGVKFHHEILKLEQQILIKLDFSIPSSTAYENLDQVVATDELDNQQTRREVAKSLKILLTAIRFTSTLSLDPSLGSKIHQITKKNEVSDHKARSIYRRCLKVIKEQMEKVENVRVCSY